MARGVRLGKFRLAVLGDAMLDVYLFGEAERVSPEAPVLVLRARREERRLGGAANVAANLKALGSEAALFSVVGEDPEGEALRELLEAEGIEPRLFRDGRPTTRKVRVVAKNQQLLRIDWEERRLVSPELAEEILAELEAWEPDAVVVEDYDKGVLTPHLIEKLRALKIPLFVDPKFKNFRLYKRVRLLKPNRAELAAQADGLAPPEAAAKLYRELAPEVLVVTLGGEGMLVAAGGRLWRVPALRREVYDVTGAGDTVIAYLTVALLSGLNPLEAAAVAALAGGVKVGKFGAAAVAPEELPWEELPKLLEKAEEVNA